MACQTTTTGTSAPRQGAGHRRLTAGPLTRRARRMAAGAETPATSPSGDVAGLRSWVPVVAGVPGSAGRVHAGVLAKHHNGGVQQLAEVGAVVVVPETHYGGEQFLLAELVP